MESEQTLIMMGQSLHQPPLPLHTTGGGGAVITHNTIVIRQTLLLEIWPPLPHFVKQKSLLDIYLLDNCGILVILWGKFALDIKNLLPYRQHLIFQGAL